jgi:hypothetical protein
MNNLFNTTQEADEDRVRTAKAEAEEEGETQ